MSEPIEIQTGVGDQFRLFPGRLWYPSLQPNDSPEDLARKRTCLRLGTTSRLWFKDGFGVEHVDYQHIYINDFEVDLFRRGPA